jgi:hypothetical protein
MATCKSESMYVDLHFLCNTNTMKIFFGNFYGPMCTCMVPSLMNVPPKEEEVDLRRHFGGVGLRSSTVNARAQRQIDVFLRSEFASDSKGLERFTLFLAGRHANSHFSPGEFTLSSTRFRSPPLPLGHRACSQPLSMRARSRCRGLTATCRHRSVKPPRARAAVVAHRA